MAIDVPRCARCLDLSGHVCRAVESWERTPLQGLTAPPVRGSHRSGRLQSAPWFGDVVTLSRAPPVTGRLGDGGNDMEKHRSLWVVAALVGAFGSAVCGSSSSTSPTTTTDIAPAAAWATGTYWTCGRLGHAGRRRHDRVRPGHGVQRCHELRLSGRKSSPCSTSAATSRVRVSVATPRNVATPSSAPATVSSIPNQLSNRCRSRHVDL